MAGVKGLFARGIGLLSGAAGLFVRGLTGASATYVPGTRPLVASFADRNYFATFLDDPTMPRHVTWTKGETRTAIRCTLSHTVATPDGPREEPLPLAGATITAQLKGTETGAQILAAPCTIVNPAATGPEDANAGDVDLQLTALQDLPVDDYQVRFTAVDPSGTQIWPTLGHMILTVRDLFTVA